VKSGDRAGEGKFGVFDDEQATARERGVVSQLQWYDQGCGCGFLCLFQPRGVGDVSHLAPARAVERADAGQFYFNISTRLSADDSRKFIQSHRAIFIFHFPPVIFHLSSPRAMTNEK
jgi:hypothetical protein